MDTVNESKSSFRGPALIAGLFGLGASAFGYLQDHGQFSQSYVMAYWFWLSLACGSLGWLMIHHLVSGRWGFVIQRPLEAASRTLPLMALLFIPVVLCMHELYEWTHEEAAHDHLIHWKQPYLNEPFFLGRAVFYFAVWILLAFVISGISRKQDETGDAGLTKKMRAWAAPGLVLYGLTATFASFDWYMSLEPHWFSSIYGALFMVGQGLTTLSFMAVLTHRNATRKPLAGVVTPQQFHDIGNLMFAFTILWAYMSFGQFLIIWSGNLYEETFWFLDRRHGGWLMVSIILFVFHFVLPFLLLLMRNNKRRSAMLAKIGIYIMAVRLVDIYWQVAPTFRDQAASIHWLDAAAFVGIGGIWLYVFLGILGKQPLLPKGDPRFIEFAKGGSSGH